MHRILKKEQILTVPNLLSLVRLALIPIIVWFYCERQDYSGTVAIIVISGLTDIADGIIARRFNMVSDFGKILDPIADKLSQAALIICLAARYKMMIPLIIVFAIRELIMLVLGYLVIRKKDKVNSSQWFGKLSTVVIYTGMSVLILFPRIPLWCANAMIGLCGVAILGSFIMYARFYKEFLSEHNEQSSHK